VKAGKTTCKIQENEKWKDRQEDIQSSSSAAGSEVSLDLLPYQERFTTLRELNIKAGTHWYKYDREFKFESGKSGMTKARVTKG